MEGVDQREDKNRVRCLKRIMDNGMRVMGKAMRVLGKWCEEEAGRERLVAYKRRGVVRRMLDKNTQMMGRGFGKLVEGYRARENYIRNKLRFVV